MQKEGLYAASTQAHYSRMFRSEKTSPVTSSGKSVPGPDPRIRHRIQIGMFRPIRVDHTKCLQVAMKTHSFMREPLALALSAIINNKKAVIPFQEGTRCKRAPFSQKGKKGVDPLRVLEVEEDRHGRGRGSREAKDSAAGRVLADADACCRQVRQDFAASAQEENFGAISSDFD